MQAHAHVDSEVQRIDWGISNFEHQLSQGILPLVFLAFLVDFADLGNWLSPNPFSNSIIIFCFSYRLSCLCDFVMGSRDG